MRLLHRFFDKAPSYSDSAVPVKIVVPAFGKTHEPLGLMGELEQALPEADRDHPVPGTVHDQERSPHSIDALVGPKLIVHQPSDRNKRKHPGGDVGGR